MSKYGIVPHGDKRVSAACSASLKKVTRELLFGQRSA
jgi:hypothetical protein